MKTLTVKCLLAIVLMLGVLQSRADYSKSIHKSWGINSVKALALESKFTNINFVNDRDDSVTIDINISIDDVNESTGEAIANQIDFSFSMSNGTLKAETDFSDRFRTNKDFTIQYTVNIPNDRDLDIENKFGNVTLGDLNANGVFEVKYGNIYGQNLMAPDNEKIRLELKYGNATFESVNRLYADLGYAKLQSGDMDAAEFDTQYSIIKTDNVKMMNVDSKYDQYSTETVDQLSVESKFTNWKVGKIMTRFWIDTQYGDVDVDQVSPDFETVNIQNSYGNIKVGISPSASYQLSSESYYCKVYFPEADIVKQIEDNNHTTIKATVGKSNPDAKVIVETKYGKVRLTK